MASLQEWKDVLEKHGIGGHLRDGQVYCAAIEGYPVLKSDDDDCSSAEFVARVTAKVFGEWAYYSPDHRHDRGNGDFEPSGWVLMDDATGKGLGYGPTKLDALYDALPEAAERAEK